jgi:hypothetical protein
MLHHTGSRLGSQRINHSKQLTVVFHNAAFAVVTRENTILAGGEPEY